MPRIMTEMSEGDSQILKTKRAEIFNIIKSLSARLEFLYVIRQQYGQNGKILPEEEILSTPKPEAKSELPDDPERPTVLEQEKKRLHEKASRWNLLTRRPTCMFIPALFRSPTL